MTDPAPPSLPALRERLSRLMRERGLKPLPGGGDEPVFTGSPENRLASSDLYFDTLALLHAGLDPAPARRGLYLFLSRGERDGFIPHALPAGWRDAFHAAPFLAQQTLLLLRAGDPLEGFHPELYFRLKNYLLHWLRARDPRGEGLAVWDHAAHSGLENLTERAGAFHDAFCEGVDLNAFLVRECEALAEVAARFGEFSDALAFSSRASRRRECVTRWCWSEKEGFYYDFHARAREPIRVRHLGAAAALWAGIPTPEQAGRLVRGHLMNPNGFSRPWPYPILALTEAGYAPGFLEGERPEGRSFRAHTWIHVNYWVFQGLRAYGFHEEAGRLARLTRTLFDRHPFRGYYASETGAPWGQDPAWGSPGLALYMEEEQARGLDFTALRDKPLRARGKP